jgi:cytochrome P450
MSAMSNYLQRLDAVADQEKWPLVNQWLKSEPLPFFEELRELRPVLVTPAATLVARFEDVADVLNQPKIFTVALYLPKMGNGIYFMCHDDDALHTREKAIMQGLLNRDDLPEVRELVGRLCREILDAAPDHRIEAAYGYCRSVPAGLVQDYFGFTGVERSDLIEWSYWNQYDTFHNQPFNVLTDEQRRNIAEKHDATGKQLTRYIEELIAHRWLTVKLGGFGHLLRRLWAKATGSKSLTDDIVARMLRSRFPGEVNYDLKRLGVNAGGLLIGAIETTSQAVAQVLEYLIEHGEWFSRAQAAARLADTTAFDGIVWEALRFVPIAPLLFRQCAVDYTIGRGSSYKTTVAAGTYILALTQSAMFDQHAFEDPMRFIPTRNWYHYFHFGFGSHECLGRYIGMVMIPEMVRQLMLRPGLKGHGRIDYRGGPFPERYDLSWDAD